MRSFEIQKQLTRQLRRIDILVLRYKYTQLVSTGKNRCVMPGREPITLIPKVSLISGPEHPEAKQGSKTQERDSRKQLEVR